MTETWETKYGLRRVRHDPPTLEEAIIAAQGLSDELDAQIEIAASLMSLSADAVRSEILKTTRPVNARVVVAPSREGAARTVIVERKPSRRVRPATA
jgi:2-phospho-L-lactate guanylyltransferase (CobY/MobA/RfbA family)